MILRESKDKSFNRKRNNSRPRGTRKSVSQAGNFAGVSSSFPRYDDKISRIYVASVLFLPHLIIPPV